MEQLQCAIAPYSSYKAQLNVSEYIKIDILVDNAVSYLKTSYSIRNRVMLLRTQPWITKPYSLTF